jgi:hypothetical protein
MYYTQINKEFCASSWKLTIVLVRSYWVIDYLTVWHNLLKLWRWLCCLIIILQFTHNSTTTECLSWLFTTVYVQLRRGSYWIEILPFLIWGHSHSVTESALHGTAFHSCYTAVNALRLSSKQVSTKSVVTIPIMELMICNKISHLKVCAYEKMSAVCLQFQFH